MHTLFLLRKSFPFLEGGIVIRHSVAGQSSLASSRKEPEMPVKTRAGWKTNDQIKRQDKAWKRARSSLIQKMGEEAIKSTEATKLRSAAIFKEMDADGNGSIDQGELKAAFAAVGVELSDKELGHMMHEADEDGCDLSSSILFPLLTALLHSLT